MEEDRERETGTHTHKSLHLQDWDEEKSSVMLLVEELWVRKHLSLSTWTKRSVFVSKYKDHKTHQKFKSVPYATYVSPHQTTNVKS